MIRQFAALCRIKELREEKLQMAVEAKRREIREAEASHQQAEEIAKQNKLLLPAREKAIWDALIGQIEKPNSFELAKFRVKRLEREQQLLEDRAKQLWHKVLELRRELEELRKQHRKAQIDRDKYQTTKQELVNEARLLADSKEEAEQEETATARFMAIA